MDSALNKVGLYDFFGVFLTGILTIAVLLGLNLPVPFSLEYTHNAAIDLILFILESYLIGLILQEISSAFDKYILNIQRTARRTFLKDKDQNKVAENELELKAARQSANEILKIQEPDHLYTEAETEYVFFHMKTFLEKKEKIEPVERINSLYGMSRSLTVAFSLCLIGYLACNVETPYVETDPVIFFLIVAICLFYRRTIRFSRYKIRKIIRLYNSMKP